MTVGNGIRARLAAVRRSQWELALAVGIGQSTLSQWLTGTVRMPDGMLSRIYSALDLLEKAERAAREARRRVLAEGGVGAGPGSDGHSNPLLLQPACGVSQCPISWPTPSTKWRRC